MRRVIGVAAAVLVLLGVGVLIGRATASSSPTPHRASKLPAVSNGSLSAAHGPTRMQGELPVGFTDDEAGALSCASVAAETLIDYVQIRRTAQASAWIATYTSGSLSAASMQKILNWNPRLYSLRPSDKPTELAPRRQDPAVTEIVPVGYRIVAFTPAAAHLQVWLHGTGWSAGAPFPNLVIDHSADIQLVWKSGDWKITSYTQPAGDPWPGPSLDDPSAKEYAPWPGGQFTFVTG